MSENTASTQMPKADEGLLARVILAICWIVTLISACGALVTYIGTVANATSAPQEAAGAAMAVAIVVIPYVFTRAVEGMIKGVR